MEKERKEKDNVIGFPSVFFAVGRRLREEARESIEKDAMKKIPCTFVDFAVLHYVNERGAPAMHDVAKILFISPPALTLVVNGMVKDGLLARTVDLADRRTIRLKLTARGKRSLKEGEKRKMMVVERVFSVLSRRERSELMKLLEKVATVGGARKKGK